MGYAAGLGREVRIAGPNPDINRYQRDIVPDEGNQTDAIRQYIKLSILNGLGTASITHRDTQEQSRTRYEYPTTESIGILNQYPAILIIEIQIVAGERKTISSHCKAKFGGILYLLFPIRNCMFELLLGR